MKRFFSLLCGATLFAITSIAQTPSQPPAVDPASGLPVPKKVDQSPRFEVHFKGGKPAELVEALARSARIRPNVIIQPDCQDIDISPFDLHDVTVGEVFVALNMLSSFSNTTARNGSWQPSSSGGGEIWLLTRQVPAQQNPFQQRMATVMGSNPGSMQPPRVCRVFNLSRYLDQFTVEDITTAVQGAWELLNRDEKPTIKYHKDTKLLIVAGEESQLLVVSDVLRELTSSLAGTPAPKTKPPTEKNL